jgi:hypothetical protein
MHKFSVNNTPFNYNVMIIIVNATSYVFMACTLQLHIIVV